MHYLVYQITNLVNGHIYIGVHQTANVDDDYMGSGLYLRHAIDKYGVENFRKTILFDFPSQEEMFAKEAELVTEDFCARTDTYNLRVGGFGGWDYINRMGINKLPRGPMTPEQIERGRIATIAARKRLLSDPERKADYYSKVSTSLKEHYRTHEHHTKGKPKPDEQRRKMSKSASGQRWIHKDGIAKHVPATEVDMWLQDGWSLGMGKKG